MLHSLTLTNFGVHQSRSIDFEQGVTAISGRNDSGKSLLVEAIRYALFGVAALRDDAPPLNAKANVTLAFSVRGEQYRVSRTPKGGKLETISGQVLAVGTKSVNLKIIELFGYGLEVFDVANCANQGLIEALSNMRPAERKRMVETTLGMDALEQLVGFCRAEATNATKEGDALARGLGPVPDEPVAPQDPRTAEELATELVSLREKANELRDLKIKINRIPSEPQGERPKLFLTETDYKLYDQQIQKLPQLRFELNLLNSELDQLSRLVPSIAREALPELKEYATARDFLENWPTPAFTVNELQQMAQQIRLVEDYQEWKRLHSKGELICPACNHTWPVEADRMKGFPDFHAMEVPTSPKLTMREINTHLSVWENRDAAKEEIAKAAATVMRYELSHGGQNLVRLKALEDEVEMYAKRDKMPSLVLHIAGVKEQIQQLEDLQRRCIIHQKALTDIAIWDSQNADFLQYQKALPNWRQRQQELILVPQTLADTEAVLVARQVYVQLHANWERARDHHVRVLAEVAAAREKAEGWKAAMAAINEVRAQIERTFVPSLAAVASALIQRMTGGAYRHVAIDPGFALTLDGQGIGSLSGSLKAVANLALRIGLGRMLTAKVFSVLILDEPDAAMDAERASSTAECLRSLCPDLAQVILVTHKSIQADHQYVLS